MLIDYTYFNWELNIPNVSDGTSDIDVANRAALQAFIDKREPEFLSKVLGYGFYKAFIAGITTTLPTLPDERWQNLIYGAEYIDVNGLLQKWNGLLNTTIPIYNFGSGYIYKPSQWIQADITTGFNSGTNTATFLDWIGWTPVINEPGQNGIMQAGVDYTFDTLTGILVRIGSNFQHLERFNVSFELQPQNVQAITSGLKQSPIANYVYYYWMRDKVSFSASIGETKTAPAAGGYTNEMRTKTARAWNEMSQWLSYMWDYLTSTSAIYPEYNSQVSYNWEFKSINTLNIN